MPAPVPSPPARRVVGVTVPLFSLRSESSWGIGEIGDLPGFAALLAPAGVALVQILPINEIAGGNTSPYGALSAFGIDPMYITLTAVDDLKQLGNAEVLGKGGAARLEAVRRAPGVDYEAVRDIKHRALIAGLKQFHRRELMAPEPGPRARSFHAFTREHAAWLDDYAVYRAIKDDHAGKPWWEWPAALRDREAAALAEAGSRLADAILYFKYVQWLAHSQWSDARAALRKLGVEIMGDLPFMVDRDSADVWANRGEFRLDMSVGVPADQFDEDGQDWGLPPYHWAVMATNEFAWLRKRARYSGQLYDRFRIDHLVGFFRTGMRPYDRRKDEKTGKLVPAAFDPPEAEAQLAHGKRVIRAMIAGAAETGAQLIAEDLGSVPDYVRPALAELDVAGYKVLIWEKDGDRFRDPAGYPERSVACFGTHDTAPVAAWWKALGPAERARALELPVLKDMSPKPGKTFTAEVHAALLRLICGARSELVLLLLQDVLGRSERINVPSTVGAHNWTYRLPTSIEQWRKDPKLRPVLERLRVAVVASGRRVPGR